MFLIVFKDCLYGQSFFCVPELEYKLLQNIQKTLFYMAKMTCLCKYMIVDI